MIQFFLIYLFCFVLVVHHFLFSNFFFSIFFFVYFFRLRWIFFFPVEFSWNVADAQSIRARRTRTVVSLQPSPVELYDRYVVTFFSTLFFRCTFFYFFLGVFFILFCFVFCCFVFLDGGDAAVLFLSLLQRPKRYFCIISYGRVVVVRHCVRCNCTFFIAKT